MKPIAIILCLLLFGKLSPSKYQLLIALDTQRCVKCYLSSMYIEQIHIPTKIVFQEVDRRQAGKFVNEIMGLKSPNYVVSDSLYNALQKSSSKNDCYLIDSKNNIVHTFKFEDLPQNLAIINKFN